MKYFKDSEVIGLDKNLTIMLDTARDFAGIPFVITSGLRSKEHNEEIGGVEDSAHLKGLAVDLRCQNSNERFLIIKGLISAGFTRIEICSRHIHADIDNSKNQCVMFFNPCTKLV